MASQSVPAATADQVTKPAFAVVSVKLSRESEADDWGIGIRGRNFWATYIRAEELIEWAYGVSARQIERAPEWLAQEHFDLEGVPEVGVSPTREQYRMMLQAALAERFGLRFHAGQKVMPVYVLMAEPGGVKGRANHGCGRGAYMGYSPWLVPGEKHDVQRRGQGDAANRV